MQRKHKTIVYVQYTRPAVYPPLERSAILLADAGWDVCFLGIALEGDPASLQLIQHPGIREQLRPSCPSGWRRRIRYPAFVLWCVKEIYSGDPDLIYCSDIGSYPIGLLASFFFRGRLVLHEHDSAPKATNLIYQGLTWIRSLFARRAALCVIPQERRAEDFATDTRARRIVVAFNCPLVRELTVKPRANREPRGLVLWYHGSLSPNQLPLTVLDALQLSAPTVILRFAGYQTISNPNFVKTFMHRAQELGLSKRVEYCGALPDRSDLLKKAASADVGLVLFSSRFRDPMVGASNKPFDYLSCGLPLLTNSTIEWEEFFGKRRVSVSCVPEDASDIARAISWLLDNPDERKAMELRGRQLIEDEWNYEIQFGRVMKALNLPDSDQTLTGI